MPTYNSAKFLKQSIESVLSQTYSNIELVITDDCSTDGLTRSVLEEYSQKDSRVRVFFLPVNNGPGYARSNSIREAKGRYIAFCDSDDRWFPEKIERQIAFMEKKQCELVFSSYLICDEENEITGIVLAPESLTFSQLKLDNKIGCLSAIYDTKRLGKFMMPKIRKRQDWAYFLMILRECKVAYSLSEPLAYYRLRPGSVSNNKFSLFKYNAMVYHEVLGYSLFASYFSMLFCFLPTYFVKVLKVKYDSVVYLIKKETSRK